MGANSKIEWTDHTFNPWRGCTRVSPGCANCYAEAGSKRNPAVLGLWGPKGTRVVAGEVTWGEPLHWQKEAAKEMGPRPRIFCASICDVFEDWDGPMISTKGHPYWWCHGRLSNSPVPGEGLPDGCRYATMDDIRARLWQLIADTPRLDWLLLTKRPDRISWCMPAGDWENVWLGTSVESDEYRWRIDALLQAPQRVPVRFVSAEPLLGHLNLQSQLCKDGIRWVIVGGESGHGARPMMGVWAESLVDQCFYGDRTPIFVKQMGKNPLMGREYTQGPQSITEVKGGDIDEWPPQLQIREFPHKYFGMLY